MDSYSDDFNRRSDASRGMHDVNEFDDLQNAIAGRDVGRQRKHIHHDDIDPVTGKKRRTALEKMLDTLEWLLANDALYKAAHENLVTTVREAQQATKTVLEHLMQRLTHEHLAMDELLSSAAKLPDGTKVFRDKSGSVRDEDGKTISDDLIATIEWNGSEPTYEEYLAQRQIIDELEQAGNELRGIETELGDIHNDATDNEKPQSLEELNAATDRTDALKDRVEEIQNDVLNKMPVAVDQEHSAQMERDTSSQKISALTMPTIPNK